MFGYGLREAQRTMSRRWVVVLVVVPLALWLSCILFLGALYLSLRYPALRPNAEEFDLAFEGSEMAPSKVTIEEGDTAYLRISTDHPLEFRIASMGFEGELEPLGTDGPDAVWDVKADRAGHFDIEDGRSGTKLGVFVVTSE